MDLQTQKHNFKVLNQQKNIEPVNQTALAIKKHY